MYIVFPEGRVNESSVIQIGTIYEQVRIRSVLKLLFILSHYFLIFSVFIKRSVGLTPRHMQFSVFNIARFCTC